MSQRERNDAIFRAALTPVASRRLTAGLADDIHDALMVTPQVRRRPAWSVAGHRGVLAQVVWAGLLVLILLAVVAFIGALASRTKPAPFGISMYRGGPARTGVMPGPGPAGEPTLLWQINAKGKVAVMPAVVGGMVYIADDSGTVQALDVATGTARWQRELGGPVDGSPAVAGGRLFVGTEAGQVVAFDAVTGQEDWRFTAGGPVRAAPAIVGDVLYVGSDDGNVYALDVTTGSQRWATSIGAPVTRGVAVADGVVYAGATGGRFDALDAGSGAVRWERHDLGIGEVATPMVSDGLVFVASGLLQVGPSDRIRALDIRDGSERWHFATADGQPLFNGAVADGAVYVSSNNGNVYRLDEASGVVAQGWPFHTGGGVGYLSGIVDGVLYVPSADRFIYAVDARTGMERWKFKVQGAPNAPSIIDGRIFVGTDLGKIIAIGGTQPASSAGP